MDLRYSDAEQAFRGELRQWLAETLPGLPPKSAPTDWPGRRAYDTHWQQLLFDAGYAGVDWPVEGGGRGSSPVEELVFKEELERAHAPYVGVNFVGLLHAGPTIIVLDAQQDELRDMNLEIRILRNVGQKDDSENLEANTEIYVAPKKYKTGTLNFEYNFAKNGNFIGLVKARSDDGTKEYVSRFPFAVGQTASKDLLTGLVLGAAGLVAFGLYYKHAFIDKKKPQPPKA